MNLLEEGKIHLLLRDLACRQNFHSTLAHLPMLLMLMLLLATAYISQYIWTSKNCKPKQVGDIGYGCYSFAGLLYLWACSHCENVFRVELYGADLSIVGIVHKPSFLSMHQNAMFFAFSWKRNVCFGVFFIGTVTFFFLVCSSGCRNKGISHNSKSELNKRWRADNLEWTIDLENIGRLMVEKKGWSGWLVVRFPFHKEQNLFLDNLSIFWCVG